MYATKIDKALYSFSLIILPKSMEVVKLTYPKFVLFQDFGVAGFLVFFITFCFNRKPKES